ncbi:MAG: DUF4832 domain-containing protein [Deltaproteobacteria bacterium]|nr:DUF4832 domain-containing protein [Deltaproteobacteria bacterium]
MSIAGCECGGDDDAEVDSGAGSDSGVDPGRDASARSDAGDRDSAIPDGPTITVNPTEVDDILYNPGMGFADFHFGWGNPPPANEHPPSTVAYFRWTWAEVEPAQGAYDFDMVDAVIEEARTKGETLAFRMMTVFASSTPQWLLDLGVASVAVDDGTFPDHNDPQFLEHHERLLAAFGERYDGSPDIDHVDIGTVGCWAEWNTACCSGVEATCEAYYPTEENQTTIIDWYFEHFPGTPLVMLVGGPVEYAVSRGAGWRGDCFGDYGMFGAGWNHMDDLYEPTAQDPVSGAAWQTAPVQFEVCGVMQDWRDMGFDIDLILQKGLDWHVSVLNAKSSPVPADWWPAVDAFLARMGYRFVLEEMTHTATAGPGESLLLSSRWANRGVAPIYHPWPLAYRLRSASDEVVAQWASPADLEGWLPGSHEVQDVVDLPGDVPTGTYSLDLGILSEDGSRANVQLAIEGIRGDGWYAISQVSIATE